MQLFLNSGTKTAYKFTSSTALKTGSGTSIKCNSGFIHVADYNMDGLDDFFTTDMAGTVTYYENRGTQDEPSLTLVGKCQSNGQDIRTNESTRIWITDWDEDGTNDMLLGTYGVMQNECLYLYMGIPTVSIHRKGKTKGETRAFRIHQQNSNYHLYIPESNEGICRMLNCKGQIVHEIVVDKLVERYTIPNSIISGMYIVSYVTENTETVSQVIFLKR